MVDSTARERDGKKNRLVSSTPWGRYSHFGAAAFVDPGIMRILPQNVRRAPVSVQSSTSFVFVTLIWEVIIVFSSGNCFADAIGLSCSGGIEIRLPRVLLVSICGLEFDRGVFS